MYTTSLGKKLEYPPFGSPCRAYFQELITADSKVITLTAENERLKHENDFMVRFISEHINKE